MFSLITRALFCRAIVYVKLVIRSNRKTIDRAGKRRRRKGREKDEGLGCGCWRAKRRGGDPKLNPIICTKRGLQAATTTRTGRELRIAKAREGREILYTWINLRFSGKGARVPVTRLPLPELDFAYFRPCRSGPLHPSPAFIHASLAIDNRGLNFNELRSLCMFARNILSHPFVYAEPVSAKQFAKEFGNGLRHLATLILSSLPPPPLRDRD